MDSRNSGRSFGSTLIGIGLLLGLVTLAWVVLDALIEILAADAFLLGVLFLVLALIPLAVGGLYLFVRSPARGTTSSLPVERRRLLGRDRTFRRILQREARRAAGVAGSRAAQAEGEAAELLRQTRQALESLADEAAETVGEADWLQAEPLGPDDVRDMERYDDLLLAGVRRLRESAEWGTATGRVESARELLDLARSAVRQFALRQDLVLRGRRLPPVGPLHLLRPEVPERRPMAPEWLYPGGAVTRGARDYLVTAHVTYFEAGRTWHALVLRGEEGERRLQVEQGARRVLFMAPLPSSNLPGRTAAAGAASASIDSLSGSAEGVVVEYRRTRGEGGEAGWWERWPEGDRAYAGEEAELGEFQFWPAAVGSS